MGWHAFCDMHQAGDTALIRAVVGNRFDCVRILLDGGANVNAANKVRAFANAS